MATKLIPDVKLVSSSSKSLEEHRRCCKDPKVCSNCAWVSKGGAWRSHFPWLRAGFAGNSNILTVGCKICALHAAKFTAAGSDTSQLSHMPLSQFGPKSLGRAGGFGTMPNPSTTLPLMQLIQLLMPLLLKNGKTSCASCAEDILSATKGTEHHRPEPS